MFEIGNSQEQSQQSIIDNDIFDDKKSRKAEKRRKQKIHKKEKRRQEKAELEAQEAKRRMLEQIEDYRKMKDQRYLDLQKQLKQDYDRERILHEFKELKDPYALVQPKCPKVISPIQQRLRDFRRILKTEVRKKETTPTPPINLT